MLSKLSLIIRALCVPFIPCSARGRTEQIVPATAVEDAAPALEVVVSGAGLLQAPETSLLHLVEVGAVEAGGVDSNGDPSVVVNAVTRNNELARSIIDEPVLLSN